MKDGSSTSTCLPETATNELLLLPDGRVLVHNLTPELAGWLAELNPGDPQLASRALPVTQNVSPITQHPV